jgi:hypothetical protein
MRIVIFHGRLTVPTGGEVNTRDWALGLKARGHRVVVFTVYPGPLAEQVRNAGIAVVDNPSSISDRPDVMFGAGVNDVATLLARFPDVPAIQVAQTWDHWNAYPCPLPQIVLHVAVDELNAEMVINEFGVPRERVRLVYNAVDVARLPARHRPLPPRPARALLFVKQEFAYLDAMRAACEARAIATDVVGYPTGRPLEDPLAAMAEYDLVVGSARTALEAAVAGAAVLVADFRGVAGMLTTSNLEAFRRNNFGRELLRPSDAATIGAEIDRYDPADATAVSQTLRQEATLDRQIDRLEAIFREAIDMFSHAPPASEDSRKALADYLALHLPRPAAGDPAPRHVRFPPNPWVDEKFAAIEQRLSAAADQMAALQRQMSAAAEHASAMDRRLSATADQAAAAAKHASAIDHRLSTIAGQAAAEEERAAAAAQQLATADERLSAAAARISLIDQRLTEAAPQMAAIEQRLGAIEAQASALRPLIKLLRPVRLVLRRLPGWKRDLPAESLPPNASPRVRRP